VSGGRGSRPEGCEGGKVLHSCTAALWCAGRLADSSSNEEEDDSEGSDSESQGQEASPAPRSLQPFQPTTAAGAAGIKKVATVLQEVWKAATGALPRNNTLFSFRTSKAHGAWWEQVRCMDVALPCALPSMHF
jgi:hypothetical protein